MLSRRIVGKGKTQDFCTFSLFFLRNVLLRPYLLGIFYIAMAREKSSELEKTNGVTSQSRNINDQ